MTLFDFDQPTCRLASYAVNLDYDSIPRPAVESTKRHLLDATGCAFGALDSHPATVARKVAATAIHDKGSSVYGLETKTIPEYAAFANTAMIRHLDFNDTGIGGHPSDMIPAILAPGEFEHASGRKVITAIFAAYEVVACLRRSGLYGTRLKEHHVDQVQSVIGSAVGAGMMYDLNTEQMANAISLAITPNIPLRVTRTGKLSDWKGCATAQSAMAGVFAARLAKEGLSGPSKPFEGIAGFYDLLDIEALELAAIGEPRNNLSAIESTCFKLYPAEYNAQGPIHTLLKLKPEINIDEIEYIRVALHNDGWREIGGGQGDQEEKWNPLTRESADHSLPYLLAAALVDGTIDLDSFSAERIADPKLRPIMKKINIISSKEMTAEHAGELPRWPSLTEIALKNGESICRHSGLPKGHPLNPLSNAELDEKFIKLCCERMPKANALALLNKIMQLDCLEDINELTAVYPKGVIY